MSTEEWASARRYLSARSTAMPGRWSVGPTPYLSEVLSAMDDPAVHTLVAMKAAQMGWTDGVMNNYIGRRIDLDPCPIIVMFPKEDAAREYSDEKLKPMVEATPCLSDKVDVSKSRKTDNRQLYKSFPGGFLKLVGSGSPTSVKSTPAPVVIVEEPDDCVANLRGQGDTIKLLDERTKTFARHKKVRGGTPSVAGLSTIHDDYKESDQREWWVPCNACGESHVLDWDNVTWLEDQARQHEVYGHAVPESARYCCPHCGVLWDDHTKTTNSARGEWRAKAEFRGIAGFALSEMMSTFPGSRLVRLVERYLSAKKKMDEGDDTDMIVFVNSALGLPYEYGGKYSHGTKGATAEALEARALDYPELVVPRRGLVVTAGIDVQHDRLAVRLRAYGRGMESWLIYWGELAGTVTDSSDPVWQELDNLLFSPIAHESGAQLLVRAVTIDCSDGKTNDMVYDWVRRNQQRKGVKVMAGKGSSNDTGDREIFTRPRDLDTAGKRDTKASRYGLQVYMVGTHRAKDLLEQRLSLEGEGPGRMHAYESVRGDYWQQVTSEVKAPGRGTRRKVWQLRPGRRNEALDCEVYGEHAARAVKLHILRPEQWDGLERMLLQDDLLTPRAENASASAAGGGGSPPLRPTSPARQPSNTKPKNPAPSGVFNGRKARGRRVRSAGVR